MTWLELQSSGPFSALKVSSVSLILRWKVSFTELHANQSYQSQELFFPPNDLDLASASTLGNTVRTI